MTRTVFALVGVAAFVVLATFLSRPHHQLALFAAFAAGACASAVWMRRG